MSMFRTVYLFELRHWLRQPLVYVFTSIMALLLFGATASDNVSIGQSFDNLLKNAPFVVESYYAYVSALALLLITAFVQATALRDVNYRTQELIFTTPLKKTPYLLGRFFGAYTISLIPQLGATLGILLGGMAPWLAPERVGPVAWGAHLNGFLAFTLPNTFIIAAIIFAIAAVTRRTSATFVGAIALLVGYGVAGIFVGQLDNERLGALLDAFGIGTLLNLTKYWTVAEQNTQSYPLAGDLLLNRAIWAVFAAVVLAAGVRIFRFTVEEASWRPWKRFRRRPAPAGMPEIRPQFELHGPLPTARLSFSGATHLRQAWSQARLDLTGILSSVPFRVILLMALVNGGGSLWQFEGAYGLDSWPVTYQLVDVLRSTMYLFTVLVLILYSGDLVWKERTARMDQIHDALPHPIWTTVVGKFAAMVGILVVLQSIAVAMGVTAQLTRGFTAVEPTVWLREMLVMDLIAFAFIAALAVVVQATVNNRFLGYFVVVGLLLLNTFIWGPLKLQSLMVRFGARPGYVYSDMNGYGPYVAGLTWFTLYWVPVAALLLLIATLLWVRGVDTHRRERRANLSLRFRGRTRAVSGAIAASWLALGGWVFYNTQVLNAYTPIRTGEERQVAYETRYKSIYQGMLQPRAVSLSYEIDIFPGERDLRTRGTARMVNKGATAIDTLFVNLQPPLDMTVDISGATLVREDDDTNVQFYHLAPSLAPGDTLEMRFTADYLTRGFENQVRVTQVAPNGTFFNNGFITPTLGYQPGQEMADRNERRKRELPDRDRMPELERNCSDACRSNYISDNADWVSMETVMSTSLDQIAVAPGSLVEEWEEEGRRYFRYVLDHRSLPFNSFISADYEVARERWGEVDLEVYYHADHPYNIEKMLRSIRRSLEYNEENFGPYMHRQARIIEFPRYASFAQAFPGTMPYSEAIGFVARIEDEDDIDMVFYVTAHEMAHQWWAHQVVGANMEGATILSETLAQYSAIMTMEREYGQDQIHKFLKYEMDNYLRSRGAEALKEKPLLRVDATQGYVHYRKGAVALYYLKEMIGEATLNSALRDLVEDFGYAEPPYPTSHELVDRLREVTPDSLDYLITDLFDEITLFDNKVVGDPWMDATDGGSWRVTFEIETAKLRADSLGVETAIGMNDFVDVAVLAAPAEGRERGEILARERLRLPAGVHTIEMTVDREPWQVAVDPDFYLIDRVPADNIKRVRAGG